MLISTKTNTNLRLLLIYDALSRTYVINDRLFVSLEEIVQTEGLFKLRIGDESVYDALESVFCHIFLPIDSIIL